MKNTSIPFTYDARIRGREKLTPPPAAAPRLTGAPIFGVRPGKPLTHRLSATGARPLSFHAEGLPPGVELDPVSGWLSGRAPREAGDILLRVEARNAQGADVRTFTLRVGDTVLLTPPMGWNSWYAHSEGVSALAIREMAEAMERKGLADHGWAYINIDDCWQGERDPETRVIRPNEKFGDMKQLADDVRARGFKLGLYTTPWISTYAGCIGGTAPNAAADYSADYLPEPQRAHRNQFFGRHPIPGLRGLAQVGPFWFLDRDIAQFAEWGIDFIKFDWHEATLVAKDKAQLPGDCRAFVFGEKGYVPDGKTPVGKRDETGVSRRIHKEVRAVDRDIAISFSPGHGPDEDVFVPECCNLWRLTPDITAEWKRLTAPFAMEERLALTRPGAFGDLDMLQIGPLGEVNRAATSFRPSPLTPAEQYFQVTLWCLLTQPLLLSCNVTAMDDFDVGLVTNAEVLAVNQDPLCRQGRRVAREKGVFEIWARELEGGRLAVGVFNLTEADLEIRLTNAPQALGVRGMLRDLWRQRDIGPLADDLAVTLSSHGACLLGLTP